MEQAAKFAESTQILMNVSEFTDVNQATDTLISSVQAFGYTAETSMEVVDLLNTIGNNYAISTADLAQSLTKSSASLVAAGGDLAEAAALTATANAIIQDADSVGTALKTTALRLRGTDVKVLEDEGLDSDGAITSKSKLQSKVKALSGVDILTDAGAYKSTYEILSEIADVWETISDIDQAALLELLAGKRNASVLAAILQSPETLKSAYEDAQNAAGSAWEENQKYLDSIQGKIDQFNNAMQSLWSHLLDSDVVKGVVEWATEIIKSLDTTEGKLRAIIKVVAIIMAYKKVNPFEWGSNIAKWMSDIHNGGGVLQYLKSLVGLAPVMKTMTAETMANTLATTLNDEAKTKAALSSLNFTSSTQALTLAQRQEAIETLIANKATNRLTNEQIAAIAATWGLKTSYDATTGSLKVLDTTTKAFMSSNIIGWIMLIISAVVGLVMWVSNLNSSIDNAQEKLSDATSQLDETKSEIESLNNELKSAKDRIAELEALPSLSFVDQEELKKLKETTAELERQLQIKQQLAASQEAVRTAEAENTINKVWHSKGANKKYYITNDYVIKEDVWNQPASNTKDVLDQAMAAYERAKTAKSTQAYILANWDQFAGKQMTYDDYLLYGRAMGYDPNTMWDEEAFKRTTAARGGWDVVKADIEGKDWDANMARIAGGINMVLGDANFKNLDYGMSDDIDAFLDEYYAYQMKWAQLQGSSSKSDAITTLFDETASEEMQALGKQLQEIAENDALTDEQKTAKIKELVGSIDLTDEAYKRLQTTMEIVGVTAQDLADYFVLQTGAFNSNTVAGVTAQYQKGVEALEKLMNGETLSFINDEGVEEQVKWEDLFNWDDAKKEATANADVIAKVLKGADETTRKQFGHLVEGIAEGTLDFEAAIQSFGLSGVQRGLKVLEASVVSINTSMFKDLQDDLSGLIDTFGELGSALESVARSFELLEQANAEMNNSGRLSLETALQLIESTEDWNEVITISNGVIKLNGNAHEALINAKLDQIRTNIELEIKELETARAQAVAAESGENLGKTLEESTNESIRQVAANLGYLMTLLQNFSQGKFGSEAFGAAQTEKDRILADTEVKKTETDTGMSRAEIEEKLEDAYARRKMMAGVTAANFEQTYFSEIVDGSGTTSAAEAAANAFQKEMQYYENRIGAEQSRLEQVQNEVDLLEARGKKAGQGFYEEQIASEERRLDLLEQQREAAQKYLSVFAEGSDEWWEVANTLNDIENEIDGVTSSIQDMSDALSDVNWYKLEEPVRRIDALNDTLGNMRDAIAPRGEEDWFDDEGMWTDKGTAVVGAYVQEIAFDDEALKETRATLDLLDLPYEGNEEYYKSLNLSIDSEQDLYDKRAELQKQEQGYSKQIIDNQQAVADMYQAQIDAIQTWADEAVEAYNDYIDAVKEALDAERDLYDFKKNIQKQTKDIGELERRIVSLSGSNNASDMAERRKLEAELYDAREALNDTYYDHANDSRQRALEEEAAAYEESMNRFIDGLRVSLDEALANMDVFMDGVLYAVTMNAPAIVAQYNELGWQLDGAIIDPWNEAAEAVRGFGVDGLGVMNSWVTGGGPIYEFDKSATDQLTHPWAEGTNAVNSFAGAVANSMKNIKSTIQSNIEESMTAISELQDQMASIADTAATPPPPPAPPGGGGDGDDDPPPSKKYYVTATLVIGDKKLSVTKSDKDSAKAKTLASTAIAGEYEKYQQSKGVKEDKYESSWLKTYRDKVKYKTDYHAKGTIGTKRDHWAITDEPQFGDELVLIPGKDGNLSFMRKGTGVVPADLTANLMEWGQLTPDSFGFGGGVNVNMINNAVVKPQYDFSFDSLVHVDNCSQDTLKDLEKMVDTKINDFSKALNYSIKRFAR